MATNTAIGKTSEIGECNESCSAVDVLHFTSLSQHSNKATLNNAPTIIEEQFQEIITDNGNFFSPPLQ